MDVLASANTTQHKARYTTIIMANGSQMRAEPRHGASKEKEREKTTTNRWYVLNEWGENGPNCENSEKNPTP